MNPLEQFLSNGLRPPSIVWKPKDLAKLYARWTRALEIPSTRWAGITAGGEDLCEASSGASAGYTYYRVTLARCECPDTKNGAPWGWCKHRIALWIRLTGQPDRYNDVAEAQRQYDLNTLFGS